MAGFRIETRMTYRTGQWSQRSTGTAPIITGTTSVQFQERLEDFVHAPPYVAEDGLLIRKIVGQPARVTKIVRWYSWSKGWAVGRHLPMNWAGGSYQNWTFPTSEWKTLALSRIQDSAPIVDLPLAIAELKDLPRTVRSLIKAARRQSPSTEALADLHLSTQFGVIPVIGVVGDLLNLQRSIAKRMERLRRKHRSKRAGGSLPPLATWWGSWPSTTGTYVPGVDVTFTHAESVRTSHSAWYTARIQPRFSLPETLDQGVSNALNLTGVSVETGWNLIPWSFLVDYFANVSSFIRAHENKVLFDVKSICIMCKTEVNVTATSPTHSAAWVTEYQGRPGKYAIVEKHRWVESNPRPELVASPILSWGQLANIAALAATAKKR